MKEIKIEDFITIRIFKGREYPVEEYFYFVDYYNEKYFYIDKYEQLIPKYELQSLFPLYVRNTLSIGTSRIEDFRKDIDALYKGLTYQAPRAEKDEYYYFIDITFNIIKMPEQYEYIDNRLYNSFNYFLTEEEAINYSKILKENLIKLRRKEAMKENK